jgi:segregation and condensation protein B
MMENNTNCTIEALILSSPEPIPIQRLCDAVGGIPSGEVRQAISDLNNLYLSCGNSFRIRELAGGYQMYILPDFERVVKKLLARQRTVRLSRAALETLAIIAYKQPVTKTEIEHIRGVATDGVLHNLLQRDMIAISGRTSAPGRPLLYKTSRKFLKFFGLNRITDLPRMEEIEEMVRQSEEPKGQAVPAAEPDVQIRQETAEYSDQDRDSGNGDRPGGGEKAVAVFGEYGPIPDDPTSILPCRDEDRHCSNTSGNDLNAAIPTEFDQSDPSDN